jgi:polyisoprenoid-binding protein YceI
MHSEGGPPRLLVEVDPHSLKVLEGRGGARLLGERDRVEIEANLQKLVLESARYPRIAFQAAEWELLAEDADTIRAAVTGDLHLHGKGSPVTAEVELHWENGVAHVTATATVVQSRWGMKPYTAFLGALKVADSVRVHVDATLPDA